VRVADDRLYGRSPKAPVLWSISTSGIEHTFAALPEEPFVIAMLSPSTSITMDVVALDNRGEALHATFSATTLPPMPHVVLNEALANPLGPEPQQEWVELVNDGLAPADLAGYVLADVGGETPLPQAVLSPGAYALIVNETFDESGESDPPPAPETLILRVPKLGKSGLSNEGEALKLLDANKATVSRLPASPKPKPGMSLARRTPSTPDGLAESFLTATPTPGQANSL